MVTLAASAVGEAMLARNLLIAYRTSDAFASLWGLDLWDVRDVMTTMLVTESYGGYIIANDGRGFREPSEGHTPWNWDSRNNVPIGTPASRERMRGILRRSLSLPHDTVGSNGRSTGPAQQLSVDTGGTWGTMAATMDMAQSMTMFLKAVNWKDRSVMYKTKRMDNWQTAMLLRVQQPLAAEVEENYGGQQLVRAQAIGRDSRFTPGITIPITPPIPKDWFTDMANNWAEALAELIKVLDAREDALIGKIRAVTPPMFQVYQNAEKTGEMAGKIIIVSGDHSLWIRDAQVLELYRAVGLAEKITRVYDSNVIGWVEKAANAKELPMPDSDEARKALADALAAAQAANSAPPAA